MEAVPAWVWIRSLPWLGTFVAYPAWAIWLAIVEMRLDGQTVPAPCGTGGGAREPVWIGPARRHQLRVRAAGLGFYLADWAMSSIPEALLIPASGTAPAALGAQPGRGRLGSGRRQAGRAAQTL